MMKKEFCARTDNGGPAFPAENDFKYFLGMSLRDYFAGQALTGLLPDANRRIHVHKIAQVAYQYADEMLKERTRHEQV